MFFRIEAGKAQVFSAEATNSAFHDAFTAFLAQDRSQNTGSPGQRLTHRTDDEQLFQLRGEHPFRLLFPQVVEELCLFPTQLTFGGFFLQPVAFFPCRVGKKRMG